MAQRFSWIRLHERASFRSLFPKGSGAPWITTLALVVLSFLEVLGIFSTIEWVVQKSEWINQSLWAHPVLKEALTGPVVLLALLVFSLFWLGSVMAKSPVSRKKSSVPRVMAGAVALSCSFYLGRTWPLDAWFIENTLAINGFGFDGRGALHVDVVGSRIYRFADDNKVVVGCRPTDRSLDPSEDQNWVNSQPFKIVDSIIPISIPFNVLAQTIARGYELGSISCGLGLAPLNAVADGTPGAEKRRTEIRQLGPVFPIALNPKDRTATLPIIPDPVKR